MRIPLPGIVTLYLLLFIGVQSVTAQAPGESVNTLSTMRRHAALIDQARVLGHVPLLVQIGDVAGIDDTGSRKNQTANERIAGVAARQRVVLDQVPEATRVKTFRHIPFMALHANEEVLLQLLDMPEIILVQQDEHYGTLLEESTAAIGAEAAWAYGGSGAGQVIAVIDTGVDGAHPFLENKLVDEACFSSNYTSTSSDFESISLCPSGEEEAYGPGMAVNCNPVIDGCSHGTRVAGIIAGRSASFSGVARDAELLALQVFSRFENYCGEESCVRSWVSDQVAALDYVYQMKDALNITAVNLSLGGGHYTNVETCDEVNPAMRILIEMLHDSEIAVIAAAGNSGLTDGLVSPACLTNAISVGATTKSDAVASFSSSAPFLDFLAPGQDITTSIPGGGFAASAGTSFSAPHVAGAWAILKGFEPNATIEEILANFSKTGIQITDDRNDVTTSRIQVDLALQASKLPVDLVSFDVIAKGASVLLSWVTANETNNAGFEIEQEIDSEFVASGFVKGQGTITERTEYSHRIASLPPGWHTFRLKQIDFDGRFSYSLEQKIFIEIAGTYHFGAAYPNPFNPQTQFSLTLANTQHVNIAVYNIIGERVSILASQQLEANRPHYYTLDGSHLPSGIYLIQITGEHFKAARSVTLMK